MPSPLVFVGEANPYGGRPDFALYCSPPESAGGRLQRLVCGLKPETYLALDRINLCPQDWNKKQARERATHLTLTTACHVIVMLGRKVQDAFGYGPKDLGPGMADEKFTWYRNGDLTMVVLPHPSGLCRVWNELDAFPRARRILKEICPSVPWGEIDLPAENA